MINTHESFNSYAGRGGNYNWVANLFKQCENVSNKEMQSLWAKLLSGEANKSGTFSKRTVDFVSTIDRRDAALFTKFAQFLWMDGEPTPLIFEVDDEIYTSQGISLVSLKYLDTIGLVSFEAQGGYYSSKRAKTISMQYFGSNVRLEFPQAENNSIQLGHVLLTNTGTELAAICGAKPNEAFFEYVLNRWRSTSTKVSVEAAMSSDVSTSA